ncbi:MAG: hypothetical protein ABIY40_00940 [Rhodanobacteraceae bacterium]|nr:hypothetical protein [Pseudomonadota bacterium]
MQKIDAILAKRLIWITHDFSRLTEDKRIEKRSERRQVASRRSAGAEEAECTRQYKSIPWPKAVHPAVGALHID